MLNTALTRLAGWVPTKLARVGADVSDDVAAALDALTKTTTGAVRTNVPTPLLDVAAVEVAASQVGDGVLLCRARSIPRRPRARGRRARRGSSAPSTRDEKRVSARVAMSPDALHHALRPFVGCSQHVNSTHAPS